MEIYELSIDSHNATELIFPFHGQKDKFLKLIDEKSSNGLSVKDEWEDFIVVKKDPKIDTNFYDIEDAGVCIIDESTCEILRPALDHTIELLPLRSDDQTYYFLNVIIPTDCLDKENSEYVSLGENLMISYKELSFYRKKITCPFFRIPELPYKTLIADDIIKLYIMQNLKGLYISTNEFLGNAR